MTVTIANVALTNTFDFWRGQTNILADTMTNKVVTTASNSAAGNAAVRGTFQSSILLANAIGGAATVYSNDTINTTSANLTVTSGLVVANNVWGTGTLSIGNTTVNTAITSTTLTTTGAISGGSLAIAGAITGVTTITSNASGHFKSGNATVNSTANATGFYVNNASGTATITPAAITVSGTVTATQNIVSNSFVQALTYRIANSTVNTQFSVPSVAEIGAGTYFLNANGSWGQVSAPASVGGANTHVQFNDGGAPGGNAAFVFNKTNFNVTLSNNMFAAGFDATVTSNALVAGITLNNSNTGGTSNAQVLVKVGANNNSFSKMVVEYNSGAPEAMWEVGTTIVNSAVITLGSTPFHIVTNNIISMTSHANNLVNFLKSPSIGGGALVLDTGYFASASDYWANTASRVLTPQAAWSAAAEQSLTIGATITPNFGVGINFAGTVNQNFTLAAPSNAKPGQTGYIRLQQDATGSRIITWDSAWKFPNGMANTLSTGAANVDVIFYTVRTSTEIFVSLNKRMGG